VISADPLVSRQGGWTDHLERNVAAIGIGAAFWKGRDFGALGRRHDRGTGVDIDK
jgi:hypothetical protein